MKTLSLGEFKLLASSQSLTWFKVSQCSSKPLIFLSPGFHEKDKKPYCRKDFLAMFSPKCGGCNRPVLENYLSAMDTVWHPECFVCGVCILTYLLDLGKVRVLLSERQLVRGFTARDENLTGAFLKGTQNTASIVGICLSVSQMGNILASICQEPKWIPALAGNWQGFQGWSFADAFTAWHLPHFSFSSLHHPTQDCFSSFSTGSFFELDGRPFCELHYHHRRGTLCHGCGQPIAGRCISAMGYKFHPEHFVCAFCLTQLSKGIFREQNDKTYCQPCFNKLFPL